MRRVERDNSPNNTEVITKEELNKGRVKMGRVSLAEQNAPQRYKQPDSVLTHL